MEYQIYVSGKSYNGQTVTGCGNLMGVNRNIM